MSQSQELYAPYIIDDFEVGDRLYHYVGLNNGRLGRVEEIHDTFLLVGMDDGTFTDANIELFDEDSPYWEWDKIIDIEHLAVGSRISRKEWNQRIFAKVTSFEPGVKIAITYELSPVNGKSPKEIVFEKPAPESGRTLEHLLLGWFLED